ncbi:uncharacterized protein LOC114715871 [Neltuma alba]|uniref:uncharacterized protein LOC114715871 n=1 Tax=Neltuma alba TaxID=207710 RepID=UPI0010A474F9|nr:uncharacterized protein LOC114715871 [Prosopis alba]
MVNTRRSDSTPVPHQNVPSRQDNDAILRELRDYVVSIDQRVRRQEDELLVIKGQHDSHQEENGPVDDEAPSDHQSIGDTLRGTESKGDSSAYSQHDLAHITLLWESFRKFDPPKFEGRLNPSEAEEWIERLETIFKMVICTSQEKVQLAEQLLQKAARKWWDSIKPFESIEITWERFKEKFFQHYFPNALRADQEAEFYAFKQGNLNEEDFIARFLELVKYITYPQMQPDSKWMADRLLEKARPELRTALAPLEINDFEKMCTKLRIIARRMREEEDEKRKESYTRSVPFMRPTGGISKKNTYSFNNSKKRFNQPSRNQSSGPSRSQFSGPLRSQFNGPPRSQCGKPDHIFRFYEEGSRGVNDTRAAVPGRVFALSQEEADTSPDLIKGILKLQGFETQALFDSGATHSFISNDYVPRLSMHMYELPCDVIVSTLAGASVKTSKGCLNCMIDFEGKTSTIDLVCLPLKGIDLIVGMNWLSANDAILDCRRKTISLPVAFASSSGP